MTKSDSIKTLSAALKAFHDKVGVIPKTATNPYFKNNYADLGSILGAIKKPLQEANLTFAQFPDGENGLTTILTETTTGEWIAATSHMMPTKNDPQGRGSAITYQRRYDLVAILGLNTEDDDDGNNASNVTTPKQASTTNSNDFQL